MRNVVGTLLLGLAVTLMHPTMPRADAAQATTQTMAPNLLANGNFEAGNVGFTSGYGFATTATTSPGQEGNYTIGTNPHLINGLGAAFGDHTTGTGQMLIVNGSTNPEGSVVWEQSMPVKPRMMYRFSFWVASWGRLGDSKDAANPAQLEAKINGEVLTAPALRTTSMASTVGAPATVGQWRVVSYRWLSGSATRVRIAIIDRNHEFIGNDFALDDLAFQNIDLPYYSESVSTQ